MLRVDIEPYLKHTTFISLSYVLRFIGRSSDISGRCDYVYTWRLSETKGSHSLTFGCVSKNSKKNALHRKKREKYFEK